MCHKSPSVISITLLCVVVVVGAEEKKRKIISMKSFALVHNTIDSFFFSVNYYISNCPTL